MLHLLIVLKSEFWNDIKFRDEKNMFDDFSFCYFKFEIF